MVIILTQCTSSPCAYKRGSSSHPEMWDHTTIAVPSASPSQVSARTELARAGLRNFVQLRHLHGWGGNQVFGKRTSARLLASVWTTSWWCATSYDYFLLLSEGRSWDCTAFNLPASTKIDYFKQLNMSTVGNGTTGVSGTGPASGYNLNLLYLLVVFFLFLYRLSVNTNTLYDVTIFLMFSIFMIYFMIFGIKLYRKMPKFLTGKT